MTTVSITGNGLEITPTMREQSQRLMNKVFERYDCVTHQIAVKQEPIGFKVSIDFSDGAVSAHTAKTHDDFYQCIKLTRDALLQNLTRQHGALSKRQTSRVEMETESLEE